MKLKNLVLIFGLLVAILFLAGLSGCQQDGAVDSNGMPQKLVMAIVQSENLDQIKAVRAEIIQFVSKKIGIPIEVIYTSDYTGVIEALKAKKVHLADIPPFAYVLATRTMKLTPLVTFGTNGKPSTYQSVIIVNGHSKLMSMADVKAKSKNLTFCFVDPASTSGHLIPRAYLNTIGLNPDSAFKQTIFAGNHLASVLAVKSGKIDVGCTTSIVFGMMERAKMIAPDDIRVLWTSDPIVAQPIVARSDLNPELVKKIQDAYLAINTERPDILQKYLHIFMRDTVKRSYVISRDADYNGLRKIAGGIKDLKAN
jgi:phosphonate transport system substrate-binding protein